MKRIYAKEEVCIGCRLCQVYCQVEHSGSKNIIKTFKEEMPPASRIIVEEVGPVSFALQCRNCDEPYCAYSCIAGAIYQDERTGEIIHDPDRCIGCWTCVLTCTKGAIWPDRRERNVAARCDMCPDREIPACVEMCPNEALYVVDED
ncbi:MAG: 4Fe-4S dicluster domain-containing protein [Deltaproteobacteria bacterium]|nr:4Fe-4S dicluster domain-containing protein [Deltaproteobacteria bacterium]